MNSGEGVDDGDDVGVDVRRSEMCNMYKVSVLTYEYESGYE